MILFKKTPAAIVSRCAITFGLMLLTVAAICVQPANAADNGIYPPSSKPFGLSYDEWSAKWWQWVYSIPLETNPQFQGVVPAPNVPPTVTVDCSLGQSGPVWFLGADFGGIASRECKDPIPPDVALFFPVTNTYFGVIGFDCIHDGSFEHVGGYPLHPVNDCSDNPWRYPDLGIAAADQRKVHNWQGLVALVTTGLNTPIIEADVDGVPIPNLRTYRAKAPMFNVTTPASNILGFGWGFPGDWTHGTGVADTYGPNGSDGYWLMLTPLTPGVHTVHFSSGNPPWLKVSYGFTVAPRK